MFDKKTVFILGAGASWHYGYPTGEELVKDVWEKAQEIRIGYNVAGQSGYAASSHPETYPRNFKNGTLDHLLRKLRDVESRILQANPLVIDDFLGRNADIADVGKLLIAMVLHECEGKSVPRSGEKGERGEYLEGGDWIRYIVHELTVGCQKPVELLENKVTFITFNYDLSLERRLHKALKNYQWFADQAHSDQFFSPERIYHVYGQLNDFNVAQPSGPQTPYRNEFELANQIDRAFDAAQNIRTISPDEKDAAPEIIEAIAQAQCIYALGYGFDRRNNELLGLGVRPERSPRQFIRFTNYENHNKVSKQVARTFHMHEMSLVGERYIADTGFEDITHRYVCEKSTKSVYDALAVDFDWPE